MHHLGRRRSASRFPIPSRRTLVAAVVACFAALAFGGTAVADVIFDSSPPVSGTKRYYHLFTAKHSGLHLNVPEASTKNGTQIIQWDGTTFMNGQWELHNPPGVSGRFSIRNRWSRQCLDVGSKDQGAPIVQQPCDGSPSQQWSYNSEQEAGDQFYRNVTNHWSGLDLNVEGGSTALGAKLIQWPRVKGAPNALFKIIAPFHVID
jgi:alpha-L-fucosidase 2